MSQSVAISSYLDADLICVQSEISSQKKLLEEMARLLSSAHEHVHECNQKDIYHRLLEREKVGNTGIGNGVALPHSRCPHINRTVIAIITLREGIDYHSVDRNPIDIAFGVLFPEDTNNEHLSLLASIAKIMSNEHHKNQLSQAASNHQVMTLIKQWS